MGLLSIDCCLQVLVNASVARAAKRQWSSRGKVTHWLHPRCYYAFAVNFLDFIKKIIIEDIADGTSMFAAKTARTRN